MCEPGLTDVMRLYHSYRKKTGLNSENIISYMCLNEILYISIEWCLDLFMNISMTTLIRVISLWQLSNNALVDAVSNVGL